MNKAMKMTVLGDQENMVVNSLRKDPELVFHCNISPAKLPDLVMFNCNIAYEVLFIFTPSDEIEE
jgi:hypothetical protein